MKIHLFKDTNGNGKMDRGEEGISNVKVRIELTNTASQQVRDNFPVDITLMTNDKGIVYFTRIPRGFYKVTIVPLIDLKEYFYLDNSNNVVELNKNENIEIPFQKADKIVGMVEMKRNKFVTKDDQVITMSNIKVTAFNEIGDSYSTFTRADGSFNIYAPGNHTYTVRIKNVFGNDFIIMNNDSKRYLSDSISQPVIIRVIEKSRKIKFKKAAKQDTHDIQKIKVLPGKIYENSSDKPVDVNSIPDFKMDAVSLNISEAVEGMFYLSSGELTSIIDVKKLLDIYKEQGIDAKVKVMGDPPVYIVVVAESENRDKARELLKGYRNAGFKNIKLLKFREGNVVDEL